MKLRQARKIMKRDYVLWVNRFFSGNPLPKKTSRIYKAMFVVNHYSPFGRLKNRLNNQYMAKIYKETKNKNKF
jgi:hypothetical protein